MKNYGYLNAVELRAIVDKLGFTQKEFAEFIGVPENTAHMWLKGRARPPKEVCDLVLQINTMVNNVIQGAIEQYTTAPKGTEVFLVTYNSDDESMEFLRKYFPDLPLSVHTAMIKRVYCELLDRKAGVHIVVFNPESYKDYLRVNKFKDTQDHRSEWACIMYDKLYN